MDVKLGRSLQNLDFANSSALRPAPAGVESEAVTDSNRNAALNDLVSGARRWLSTSVRERMELLEQCVQGVHRVAREWVDECCRAKGIPAGSPARSEEIAVGPIVTARYLQLLIHSLRGIERHGTPQLPGRVQVQADGRLHVPVFPANGLYDRVLLPGFNAYVRMQDDVNRENLRDHMASAYRDPNSAVSQVSLVLGAGNVSSIPATDALGKLFQEGKTVALKMSPVNEYLGRILEQAFAPLVERGLLRIFYGDARVGAILTHDDRVDDIHVTGSIETHDQIVWGPTGLERSRRKHANEPVMKKPVTSELGSVSPWIVVPGAYSQSQLAFQAENIAASVTNNASFNCAATDVILTWKRWTNRSAFLDRIESVLARVPERKPYYPGAIDRFDNIMGTSKSGSENRTLPWTLIRDVDPKHDPAFFQKEAFVCVFCEVAIDAPTEHEFLKRAVDFVNTRLWGSLCSAVTVPAEFRRRTADRHFFDSQIHRLQQGTVGINQWPGFSYALASTPWGGAPGHPLSDAQSGIGWSHNSYMLEGIEKTVLEGPLVVHPKPFSFPTHTNPEPIAWQIFDTYCEPSLGKLCKISWLAARDWRNL